MPELDPYQPKPMNWCTLCGVHTAIGTRCPVCADDHRRRVLTADARMASTCRG